MAIFCFSYKKYFTVHLSTQNQSIALWSNNTETFLHSKGGVSGEGGMPPSGKAGPPVWEGRRFRRGGLKKHTRTEVTEWVILNIFFLL